MGETRKMSSNVQTGKSKDNSTDIKNGIRFQITARQYLFILIGSATGSGILSLPRMVNKEIGHDGWISVFLGGIVPVVSLLLIAAMFGRFPGMDFFEIAEKVFGKLISKIFLIIYTVYIIFVVAASLRIFVEITGIYILPRTPIQAVMISFLALIIYSIKNGSRLVGRFNELAFYVLPAILLLMLASLTTADFTNIMPVGEAGILKIFQGTLISAYSYASTEQALVYAPMVKNTKKVLGYGIIAMAIVAFMYTYVTVICTLVFGENAIQTIIWPPILLYKIVAIPVIERLDIFFVILWITVAVRPSVNYLFVAAYSASRIIKIKKHEHFAFICVLVAVLIFLLDIIPRNVEQFFALADILGYGYYVAGIIFPLMFIIASLFIRNRRSENG